MNQNGVILKLPLELDGFVKSDTILSTRSSNCIDYIDECLINASSWTNLIQYCSGSTRQLNWKVRVWIKPLWFGALYLTFCLHSEHAEKKMYAFNCLLALNNMNGLNHWTVNLCRRYGEWFPSLDEYHATIMIFFISWLYSSHIIILYIMAPCSSCRFHNLIFGLPCLERPEVALQNDASNCVDWFKYW